MLDGRSVSGGSPTPCRSARWDRRDRPIGRSGQGDVVAVPRLIVRIAVEGVIGRTCGDCVVRHERLNLRRCPGGGGVLYGQICDEKFSEVG